MHGQLALEQTVELSHEVQDILATLFVGPDDLEDEAEDVGHQMREMFLAGLERVLVIHLLFVGVQDKAVLGACELLGVEGGELV